MPTRLTSALVATGLVVVSAAGLRLSEIGSDFDLIRGVSGTSVAVNDGEVTVSRAEVGTSLITYGRLGERTDGMFVVVTVVSAATGRDRLTFGNAALVDGDTHYDAFSTLSSVRADPGFQTTTQLTFEVDPRRLDGDVALELHPYEIVAGYQERLHIRLADDITVAGWAAEARGRSLEIDFPKQRALP